MWPDIMGTRVVWPDDIMGGVQPSDIWVWGLGTLVGAGMTVMNRGISWQSKSAGEGGTATITNYVCATTILARCPVIPSLSFTSRPDTTAITIPTHPPCLTLTALERLSSLFLSRSAPWTTRFLGHTPGYLSSGQKGTTTVRTLLYLKMSTRRCSTNAPGSGISIRKASCRNLSIPFTYYLAVMTVTIRAKHLSTD